MEPEVPRGDAQGHKEGANGGSVVVHAAQLHEDDDSACLNPRGIGEIVGRGTRKAGMEHNCENHGQTTYRHRVFVIRQRSRCTLPARARIGFFDSLSVSYSVWRDFLAL